MDCFKFYSFPSQASPLPLANATRPVQPFLEGCYGYTLEWPPVMKKVRVGCWHYHERQEWSLKKQEVSGCFNGKQKVWTFTAGRPHNVSFCGDSMYFWTCWCHLVTTGCSVWAELSGLQILHSYTSSKQSSTKDQLYLQFCTQMLSGWNVIWWQVAGQCEYSDVTYSIIQQGWFHISV